MLRLTLSDEYGSKGLQINFVGFQTNDILKVINKHFTLIAVSKRFHIVKNKSKGFDFHNVQSISLGKQLCYP